MLHKYFLFTIFSLILLTGCTEAQMEKVVIYDGERTSTITDLNKLQYFGENISGITRSVDDVLQVILTPSQIGEIINNEDGVEIIYSGQHQGKKINNRYSISFSKLYIPFSGKYSKFGVVIFFGDDEGYGGLPPFIKKEGLRELKQFVHKLEE